MFNCSPWSRRYAYAHAYRDCGPSYYSNKRTKRTSMESRRHRSGGFGVRRPLRYLSYHLDLDDVQRRKFAASFEKIKLEREQAKIDRKKADAKLADELSRVDVSVEEIKSVLASRDRIADASQTILAEELHGLVSILDSEQLEEFVHLVRSGVIQL